TLPPGRLRLATKPVLTGSKPVVKTIVPSLVSIGSINRSWPARLPCRSRGPVPSCSKSCLLSSDENLLTLAVQEFSFLHAQPRSAALTATIRPRPTCPRLLRMAQHHDRVARGAHEVVTLLVHPSVPAMVKPVFVEPIGKVLEDLEAPTLHPNQHVGNAGFDRHAAILELCVGPEHVEPLRRVLLGQRNAGAFQGLAPAITRPRPR